MGQSVNQLRTFIQHHMLWINQRHTRRSCTLQPVNSVAFSVDHLGTVPVYDTVEIDGVIDDGWLVLLCCRRFAYTTLWQFVHHATSSRKRKTFPGRQQRLSIFYFNKDCTCKLISCPFNVWVYSKTVQTCCCLPASWEAETEWYLSFCSVSCSQSQRLVHASEN